MHDQRSLAARPRGPAAGYQRWRGLLFLHWRVDARLLRPLVPRELEIETFDGDAWLALVSFAMDRIRPRWFPPVPGLSWFLETNVRTYVRHAGSNPGVWFLSLDANNRLAVTIARRLWHLNYYFARLSMRTDDAHVRYTSAGRRGDASARYDIEILLRDESVPRPADPGSLEYFLLERYLMYARHRRGMMFSGRVFHSPYQFRPADVLRLDQYVLTADGVVLDRPCDHAVYSPGVDVEVFSLTRV